MNTKGLCEKEQFLLVVTKIELKCLCMHLVVVVDHLSPSLVVPNITGLGTIVKMSCMYSWLAIIFESVRNLAVPNINEHTHTQAKPLTYIKPSRDGPELGLGLESIFLCYTIGIILLQSKLCCFLTII